MPTFDAKSFIPVAREFFRKEYDDQYYEKSKVYDFLLAELFEMMPERMLAHFLQVWQEYVCAHKDVDADTNAAVRSARSRIFAKRVFIEKHIREVSTMVVYEKQKYVTNLYNMLLKIFAVYDNPRFFDLLAKHISDD